MLPLLAAFLSGLSGALYGLSYKLRVRGGYSIEWMLFLFSLFSTLLSCLAIPLFGESFWSLRGVFLGVPYGISTVLSLSFYFRVTTRARLNVTWLFIQLSVILPFLLSVFGYGERLTPRVLAGIACVFLAILFFGLGKREPSTRPAIPDRKTGIYLLLSALFTGIATSVPKLYAAAAPESGTFTLLLYRGLSMSLGSGALLVMRGALRAPGTKPGPRPGGLLVLSAYMSLTGILFTALIIVALGGMAGSIAYPLSTVVNVLCVFLFSFILFRERVSPLEGAGCAVALVGIALVSGAAG